VSEEGGSRFHRAASGVLLALVAAAVAGLSVTVDCLVVEAPAGRAVRPLGPPGPRAGSFVLSFMHSVAKLPVAEYFRPRGGEIQLYRTVYKGLGAGLPFGDEGGTVSIVDGSIVIEGLDRRFRSIAVSPSSLTENRLAAWGNRYDLLELIGGSGTAILVISRRPILYALIARTQAKGELQLAPVTSRRRQPKSRRWTSRA
jgi:hypothetical protein